VAYRIEGGDSEPALIRREVPLLPAQAGTGFTELVWRGAARIALTNLGGQRLDPNGQPIPPEAPAQGLIPGMAALPRVIRLELLSAKAESLFQQTLVLRPELP
jgi:hypothetical protein